jgi:hypothetical protein
VFNETEEQIIPTDYMHFICGVISFVPAIHEHTRQQEGEERIWRIRLLLNVQLFSRLPFVSGSCFQFRQVSESHPT